MANCMGLMKQAAELKTKMEEAVKAESPILLASSMPKGALSGNGDLHGMER